MTVKVKSEVGLTLKLFKDSQYEFIRPSVGIEIEVESEKDIKPRLALAVKALKETWDETTNQLSEQVLSQLPQINKEMELQISKKMLGFEKQLNEFKQLVTKK